MKNLIKLSKERIFPSVLTTTIWVLLALGFVFSFSACNKLKVEPLANYIIDEGTHNSYSYSQNNRRRENIIAPILIRGNRLEWEFRFNESHVYDFTVKDGGDINKLYGIGSTKVHQNSARIGWRYIGNNKFELYAYWYALGNRDWKLLDTVEINVLNKFTIDVSHKKYAFEVNNKWFTVYGTKNIMAFRLFPYFGGDNPAPHRMYFTIVEL